MRGILRDWWWLLLGALAVAVGAALLASVPWGVSSCYSGGVTPDGAVVPQSFCQDELDAVNRHSILGSASVLAGCLVVAYGFGYRRGNRAGMAAQKVQTADC